MDLGGAHFRATSQWIAPSNKEQRDRYHVPWMRVISVNINESRAIGSANDNRDLIDTRICFNLKMQLLVWNHCFVCRAALNALSQELRFTWCCNVINFLCNAKRKLRELIKTVLVQDSAICAFIQFRKRSVRIKGPFAYVSRGWCV